MGTITLNRPERRNALSLEMVEGLTAALRDMEASKRVGAIVLTGAGGAFCAGGDVKEFFANSVDGGDDAEIDIAAVEEQRRQQEQTVGRIYRCRKPILASLPGAAAGAGLGLALAADLRIGCTQTVIMTAFAGVGLPGDYGVAWLLDRLVGPAKAREMLLLNSRLDAEKCLNDGLVNWVVPDSELPVFTQDVASQLARGPSAAFDGMKQNLLLAPQVDLGESMRSEVTRHKAAGLTSEHSEAVEAFVHRRLPSFATGWHEELP